MSGIVRFFEAATPLTLDPPNKRTDTSSSCVADGAAAAAAASSASGGGVVQQSTSGAGPLGTTGDAAVATSTTSARPRPLMSAESYGRSLLPPPPRSQTQPTSAGPADLQPTPQAQTRTLNQKVVKRTSQSLTVEQWTAQRKKAFAAYMNQRLTGNGRDNDGDDNDDNKDRGRRNDVGEDGASPQPLSSSLDRANTSSDGNGSPDSKESSNGGGGGSPIGDSQSPADTPAVPEADLFNVLLDTQEPPTAMTATPPDNQEQSQDHSQSQDPDAEITDSQPATQDDSALLDTQLQTQSQQSLPDTQAETPDAPMNLAQDSQESQEEEAAPELPDTQEPESSGNGTNVAMDIDQEDKPPAEDNLQTPPTKDLSKKRKKGSTNDKKERSKSDKKRMSRAEKKALRRRQSKDKIVHESQTSGTANTIDEINQRVRAVNLGLCRVVSFQPLRKIHRMQWQAMAGEAAVAATVANADTEGSAKATGGDDAEKNSPSNKVTMLSCPFDGFEADGPLSCIYKTVLSLEVVQVVDEEEVEAKQAERRLFQRPFEAELEGASPERGTANGNGEDESRAHLTKRRILVFLYEEYAVRASHLLAEWKYREKANSKSCALSGIGREEILISLQNVPARCVLPYNIRLSSGVESALRNNELGCQANYCLGIGSDSLLKVSYGQENMEKVRFDTSDISDESTDLEMRIVMVRRAAVEPTARSPARAQMQHSEQNSDAFQSTAENILSFSAIEDQALQKVAAPDSSQPSQLMLQYAAIITKSEKRMQTLAREKHPGISNELNNEVATADEGVDGDAQEGATGSSRTRPAEEALDGPDEQAARKRRRKSAGYTPLKELRGFFDNVAAMKRDMQSGVRRYHRLDDTVNIYGIALSATAPHRTKRGDWMVTIHLIDDSLDPTTILESANENNSNANNGPVGAGTTQHVHVPSVTLLVFCPDESKLPTIHYAGDVIRAHRVVVQEWSNEIQLVGRRNSSFSVVRPRDTNAMMTNSSGQGWIEDHSASKPSILDDEDYLHMRDLWRWGRKRIIDKPTVNDKERFTISDVASQDDQQIPFKQSVNGDITAMVAGFIPYPDDDKNESSPQAFLRLWDGTGPPISDSVPIKSKKIEDAIRSGEPPASALVAISKIIPSLTAPDGDTTPLETPKMLCGRIINAVIWERSQGKEVMSSQSGVKVGSFIRLRNVNDGRLATGLRCLMIHQKSSVTTLPEQTYEVNTLLREHNARLLRKDPPNELSGILPGPPGMRAAPITDDPKEQARARTVEALFAAPSDQPNEELYSLGELCGGCGESHKTTLTSRFVIIQICPQVDLETGRGLKELCVPSEKSPQEQMYQFVLKLRDSTEQINVIVLNNLATTFMKVSATDICKEQSEGRQSGPKCQAALRDIKALLKEGVIWEGDIEIQVINDEQFFILKSLKFISRSS